MRYLLTLLIVLAVTPAWSQGFREGVLAVERQSDPPWSYVFAFVSCDGKLRLSFHADKRLNKVRKQTNDGGLFFKFNKNQYQMTFYPDGRAKRRDGTFIQWRYPDSAELAQEEIPSDALALAKAKCR